MYYSQICLPSLRFGCEDLTEEGGRCLWWAHEGRRQAAHPPFLFYTLHAPLPRSIHRLRQV